MLILGPLAFAAPWILSALAVLPVLIWLMRITPPAPKRIDFPAIRLLFGLHSVEETPARTPLWLMILRSAVAALVILALAKPILNPGTELAGSGTLVLVVDDGWAAANNWQARRDTLLNLIARAGRAGREVLVLATAPPADGSPVRTSGVLTAAEARELVQAMVPKPWPVDRRAAAEAIATLRPGDGAAAYWLTDGVTATAAGEGAEADVDDGAALLARRLRGLGSLEVLGDEPEDLAMSLSAPLGGSAALRFTARRPAVGRAETVWVRASAERSQILARQQVTFEADTREAEFALELPPELRNRVIRVEIEQERSAGAVALLDERWRRRPVGLVAGDAERADQPLLGGTYYLERALTPFADVRHGTISELLERELSVLALDDVGKIVGPERALLENWVGEGGVLVRFAGPRMAQDTDDLVPARLRPGERNLGGAMTWTTPAKLAPFPETSPFFGLPVPEEVRVNRQVLAEPTLDIGEKTWARLEDGTPLVTGARHGSGWLILFHTTANTTWSDLPLSGLFVEMLRTAVRLSQGVEGQETERVLSPLASLDGFGRLGGAAPTAQPLAGNAFATTVPAPRHPPGFYGSDDMRQAYNLGAVVPAPRTLTGFPEGVGFGAFSESRERNLMPWLLSAAIVLALAELIASLMLRGLLRPGPGSTPAAARAGLGAAVLLALVAAPHGDARAQPAFDMEAALETRLAYVITGNDDVDRMSELGLLGLTRVMAARTAVEASYPVGVDPERHELAFFPLLYWPMTPDQRALSPAALGRLDQFMKNGGTILFDTRDQSAGGGDAGPGIGTQVMRRIVGELDIPPLVPVPPEHVLTQAFYLLQEFPGRWEGGAVWVVQHPGGVNDGVSSVVIGANDWAAAWALDEDGWPLAAVSSGDERQRELAFRFGINLVMYALTGSYKADQLHLPAIMERLGQ